ncbi:hypothetical protein [Paenarthrobacter sp. NPDC089316]
MSEDQELGWENRPGVGDALPLPTGQFVWMASRIVPGVEPL